ncbi:hypothetical protein TNCV_3988611 [Trichonephila clavipes]|nr:hypothetical protein TNCV_3988611 [Trichonephila clavipes]
MSFHPLIRIFGIEHHYLRCREFQRASILGLVVGLASRDVLPTWFIAGRLHKLYKGLISQDPPSGLLSNFSSLGDRVASLLKLLSGV